MFWFGSARHAKLWLSLYAKGDCSVIAYADDFELAVYEWRTIPAIWRDLYGPAVLLDEPRRMKA